MYDSGGAAVRLRVASSSAQCPSGPVAITIAPAPTVTLAQPFALSGTTSGLADGTQITVTVVGTDGVPHNYPATVTGGAWSVNVPAGTLPAGSYDVTATTPSGLPATTQGTVLAPVLAPAPLPATIGPSETVNLSGTLTNVPVGTPVTIELAGPGGSVQTFTTQTTDAAGNYGPVPAGPLAPGSYTATTSATGVTPQQQTFSVVAPAVPVLSPAPLPATVGPSDNVDLSGTLTNVPAGTTVTITITGPNGFTRTLTATTDGAGAYGPVPAGTLRVWPWWRKRWRCAPRRVPGPCRPCRRSAPGRWACWACCWQAWRAGVVDSSDSGTGRSGTTGHGRTCRPSHEATAPGVIEALMRG